MKELIEKLAAIEHQRWADWQKYCHSKMTDMGNGLFLPRSVQEGWERQIATPYSKLSEQEKESDREQVRRYFPMVEKYNRGIAYHILEWIKKKSLREQGLRVTDIEEFINNNFLKS
jgi:hypothetical protein